MAALPIQAVTSHANQIAHARTKSRSFAGGGSGQRGKPKRQSPSLSMAFQVGFQRNSIENGKCPSFEQNS